MQTARPYISIIIPTFNARGVLLKLLRSIDESEYREFETIVVDDGSTDGTIEMLRHRPVRVLRTPKNSGPAFARNLGAAEANGEVILLLDSDVILGRETLGETARFFQDHPDRAVMIGVYDPEPVNDGPWPLYKALQCYSYYRDFPPVKKVSLLWAAVAAFRRSLYIEMGGFDARFSRPSMEDLEFGRRISARTPIYLNRRVAVGHHFPATFRKNVADHFDRGRLWVRIWFRHHRFDNYLSTPRRAVGRIAATLSAPLIVASFFRPDLAAPATVAFAVYALCNYDLWSVVVRRSPRFLPTAFAFDYFLGLVLGAATVRAVAEEAIERIGRLFRRSRRRFLEPLAPEAEGDLETYGPTGTSSDGN